MMFMIQTNVGGHRGEEETAAVQHHNSGKEKLGTNSNASEAENRDDDVHSSLNIKRFLKAPRKRPPITYKDRVLDDGKCIRLDAKMDNSQENSQRSPGYIPKE